MVGSLVVHAFNPSSWGAEFGLQRELDNTQGQGCAEKPYLEQN